MKTIGLALLGTIFLFIALWLFVSYLFWQINPAKWGEDMSLIWSAIRMVFMAFIGVYIIIKISNE